MTRLERFESLIDLARDRERHAARQLGDARHSLQQEQTQLDALRNHFDEYSERLTMRGQQPSGVAVSLLREYQHFLGMLDRGIGEQSRRVEQQRQACDLSQQSWVQSRVRLQALDKATERLRDEELRTADRREQREMDELSARRSA